MADKVKKIVYILLRLSSYIKRQTLSKIIEERAIRLLDEVAADNLSESLKLISSLDSLIDLGKMIYEIEPINSVIIHRELMSLSSEIRQRIGFSGLPNLKEFFSDLNYQNQQNTTENEESDINSEVRQSSVLGIIRKSSEKGGCQVKDLISEFPNLSERTLRYDLQKLISRGLVSKVGSTGPGTSYMANV